MIHRGTLVKIVTLIYDSKIAILTQLLIILI